MIYIVDTPKCSDRLSYRDVGVSQGETVTLSCHLSAEPAEDLSFYWSFNSTDHIQEIPNSYTKQNGAKSKLTFTPTEAGHYGSVYCWARNIIGLQRKPCTFFIYRAGMYLWRCNIVKYMQKICMRI